jgi:dihydrofolate synthase/folylpolyglutamate synthase
MDGPLEWLLGLEKLGMKFGLENMAALTAALDHPQHQFRSVLIAGTNGKGSVTAIVETALRLQGYRAARYTSPHLERLEERFVIDGREVDADVLVRSVGRVRDAVDRLLDRGTLHASPTFFEVTTAVAFDLFREAAIEVTVLEVGLGGRLDSTNVVEPIATAITTIALDHQAQLGSTLASIAREKAGIMRRGVPVVVGRLPDEADGVITARARELGAPLVRAHQVVAWPAGLTPALPGEHQVDNAIVAMALLGTLADLPFRRGDQTGFPVSGENRRRAVETVRWPGRLERLTVAGGEILLDAAHNPAGAAALASYLRASGWTDAVLVFGAMADKDAAGMLAALAPSVSRIICTTAPTARAEAAAALAVIAAAVAGADRVEAIDDPEAAVIRARELAGHVVVAGSMFLIGPLRGILR